MKKIKKKARTVKRKRNPEEEVTEVSYPVLRPYLEFEKVLSTEIENIIVIIRVEPYFRNFADYSGIEKTFLVKDSEFKFPRRLMIKFPLNLNYDGYLYENENNINALIVKEINNIINKMRDEAQTQFVRFFDGVQFVIEYIGSKQYKTEQGIAEWIPET